MVTSKRKEKRGRRLLNDSSPSAVTREILEELSEMARPTQRLDIVPWLEKHRRLSPESSAEPGRWSFDRFPYGREISRAIADPNVREVVVSAASQVGKSELCTFNPVLYWASVDPGPCLIVAPTLLAGRSLSLDRFNPMIRGQLRPRRPMGTRGDRRRKLDVSQESRARLSAFDRGGVERRRPSMRPIRYLIFEELSRLPLMAKGRAPEGDVVALAKVRTSTFGASAKVIYSSSPVELESCRITALFEDSTQEHYYSRCPAGHYQVLALAEMNFETGACRCATCDREHNQLEWLANEGVWRAHGSHPFRRGFHLACWPSPLIDWREVHAAWRGAAHLAKAGDHSSLRAILNCRLAEPFISSKERSRKTILPAAARFIGARSRIKPSSS
jgi:phage terminase large subunit GpA-like protein